MKKFLIILAMLLLVWSLVSRCAWVKDKARTLSSEITKPITQVTDKIQTLPVE